MLPYALIPLIAVVVLTIQHVRSRHASIRSKYIVAGLAVVSILVAWVWPLPALLVVLFQLALCGYVIVHQMVMSVDDAPPARW
jgi:hypothetical protein